MCLMQYRAHVVLGRLCSYTKPLWPLEQQHAVAHHGLGSKNI